MKNKLRTILYFTALSQTMAFATFTHAEEPHLRTLKDTTTNVILELNEKTVFCTDRGYGNIQLKVSVPDLDWLAHFDHRVASEGLPCMTGGSCVGSNTPDSLIKIGDALTIAPIRVILTEQITIHSDSKKCERYLIEKIQSSIHGKEFTHQRTGELSQPTFEVCQALIKLN